MRIGYVVADFDVPLHGQEGCSLHIQGLTNALRTAGHEAFFMSATPGGAGRSSDRVHHIDPAGLAGVAWQALEASPAVWEANLERDLRLLFLNEWLVGEGSAIVEREQPDVLYERYSLFGWGGAELSRRHGIPLLLEVNTDLRAEQDGFDKFVLTDVAERIEREVFATAAAVFPVSEWLAEWVVSRGVDPARVHVVPNGVEADLFAESVPSAGPRRRYGVEGKRVVGFVGSFQPWHDLAGLMHAFELVHAGDPETRLLVVGDGDSRASLLATARERGVEEAVTFTGHLPHDRIPEAIAAMDVAVAPYNGGQELGFLPMKLFEYMAAGKPTVAAAVGAIPTLLEDGVTGRLYPPGDDESLAAAIRELLTNGDAASMGVRARDRVLRDYTWDAAAEKVVRVAGPLIR